MLGDSPEKSKNPLKKAMRRRNAKTVQFAPPTFFEPPHAEYSTEDEGESDAEYNIHPEENTDLRDGDQDVESNEVATVEPSNPRTQGNDVAVLDEVQGSGDSQGGDEQRTTIDSERTSDENLERSGKSGEAHPVASCSLDLQMMPAPQVGRGKAPLEIRILSSKMITWRLGRSILLPVSFATIRVDQR